MRNHEKKPCFVNFCIILFPNESHMAHTHLTELGQTFLCIVSNYVICKILIYHLIFNSQDLEISSASPQVFISVNLDAENDNCICDVKLQQADIAKMVKENNLDLMEKFRGISRIAEALGIDLEKGINGLLINKKSKKMHSSQKSITKILIKLNKNKIKHKSKLI